MDNFKKISEIFKKSSSGSSSPSVDSTKRTDWGGSGSFPALGKVPALPTVPAVNLPPNMPRFPEPNVEALKNSNEIIKTVGLKS